MSRIILILLLVISLGMSAQKIREPKKVPDKSKKFDWIAKKDTSITGKALNAKAGAVIIDLSEEVYYIDGLDGWSEKLEGKILKVTGRLAQKIYAMDTIPPDPTKPMVQSSQGTMTYITKARWGILKK